MKIEKHEVTIVDNMEITLDSKEKKTLANCVAILREIMGTCEESEYDYKDTFRDFYNQQGKHCRIEFDHMTIDDVIDLLETMSE